MTSSPRHARTMTTDRRSLLKASAGLGALAVAGAAPMARLAGAQEDRTFIYAYGSDVTTFDPQLTTDLTSQMAHFQIFESLVKMGREGQFEGVLAESWETLDDVTWRFNLRQGVMFHNGEPFNADAVAFTLDRIRDPELASPGASGLIAIDRIEVVDEFTVDIVTTAPYAALLSVLYASLQILPPGYIGEVGNEGFAENPVGTGPFAFVEWRQDVEVRMEAYADHWRGAPAVSELIFRPIPEDSARIAALQNQEVHWIAALNVERASEFEGNGNIVVAGRPGQGIYGQMDTLRVEPFMNREVRQALNHAVNVDSIINDLLDGRATRLPGALFTATPGFDPDMPAYTYDPELAREMLAEAGYEDGFEVTFNLAVGLQSTQKFQEIGEAIAQDLSLVNVTANIEVVDPGIAFDRYHNEEYEFFIFPWGSSHESGRYIETLLHSDTRGYYYQNPEADALIDEFMQTIDPDERAEVGRRLNEYLQEDAPWIFLYQEPDIYGYLPEVAWEPNPYDVYFHAYEVSFQ